MKLNAILLQRLEKKGVTASEAMRLIRDVAMAVSAGHSTDPELMSRRLQNLGWHGLELDAHTLELIIHGFGQAGQMVMEEGRPPEDPEGLQQLVDKIFHERGIDFRGYSHASLSRRFSRRLQDCGVSRYRDYLPLLDKDPGEYVRLINSIFVTVTRFFRNKKAFDALTKVLDRKAGPTGRRQVNIWCAGCATGQEPYSIAMLAADQLSAHKGREVRIVATDIDDAALAAAGKASFSQQEIDDVPAPWRHRYFDKTPAGFQIGPAVRDMVTFEHRNLVSDRAIEETDLITCRNVLIYFNPALQMRVIDKFYHSLRPGGHLLLGRYEMLIKQARRQFACVDFDARLYRKR